MPKVGDVTKDVDWSEVEDDAGFDPIPPGEYRAEVHKAELKENKKGTGYLLKFDYLILGPSYAGRHVFQHMNIKNQSAKAQSIGRRQYKSLSMAAGHDTPPDDQDVLLGESIQIKVKNKKETYQGEERVKEVVSSHSPDTGEPKGEFGGGSSKPSTSSSNGDEDLPF